MVVTKSCIDREVKQHDSAGGQDLRKDSPASLVIPESGKRKADTKRDADRYAAQFSDPAVVKCILQKERGREEDQ